MSVPLIPRDVLFGNPLKASPRLSPDGTALAWLAPVDGVLNVWVGRRDGSDARPVTQDTDRGIRRYFFSHDGTRILYLQDVGGDENWRLFSVTIDGGEVAELTPFDDVQVRIVEYGKHHPDEMLLGINRDNPQLHDVYKLQLSTGKLDKIVENPGNVIGWMVDFDLNVRGATAPTAEGGMQLLVRDTPDDDWRELVTWQAEDALTSGPVSFSGDGASVIMTDSRGANSGRLVRLDIATGATEVLAEDPTYDAVDVMLHPDTWAVQAVAFCREREQWQVLDESIAEDFKHIEALQRGDFGVTSRDHADATWLVAFTVDNGPVSYYAWDRADHQATFLFNHMPQLENYELAEMEPMSFTTRDGLTVHGYITFPPGAGCQNLPMVLLVHGGPWARDTWGYDGQAQWLANRGYLCLQVNYRGSTGYGKKFVNKGNKQWGAAMHDDLLDAVRWAVDQGFADPEKVAVFGGSYGGYAALVGATMTPEVFCCAVDIVGPSNLLTFINSIPPYWKPMIAMLHQRVGNPETEEEMLKQRSPLTHVDHIRIPMLIAQGKNDPRVVEAESVQIVEAMKAKGIDHEYMLFEDEGHGFAKPENRLKFMAAAERFLARHLGGRVEDGDE